MKKTFALFTLAFAAATASAAGPVVGLSYDVDRANGEGFNAAHEVKLSVAQDTRFGTFDGGVLLARYQGESNHDDANGFELGYGNGFAFGQYGVKARVAYGRLNQIDPNGGGFTGNASYASVGVEGAVPVSTTLNGFVGYRHRNGLNSDTPNQNRYTVGVDYAVTKTIALRAGFAHTRQADLVSNGLTTGVSYNF
jgi:hypothetical protein